MLVTDINKLDIKPAYPVKENSMIVGKCVQTLNGKKKFVCSSQKLLANMASV